MKKIKVTELKKSIHKNDSGQEQRNDKKEDQRKQ
jgi:hypothetical protein